ncbi:MAG TPA: hypothetical protein VHE55_15490 [Fimbriimonadaceae bacterium]|nr:hypothetical protein [Fimbriimonadaceae bacterium]
MATQSSPRGFSWLSLGVSILIAIGLGVGIAYVMGNAQEKPAVTGQVPPPAPAEAPLPPKIDFLGAGTVAGKTSTYSKDGVNASADLGPDDAMIVWLKMDVPGGGNGGRGGPGGRATNMAASPAALTPAGSGGRGGRGPRAPLTVKDPDGHDYSYSMERKDDGVIALHLKRGYDKKPSYLTVAEVSGDKTIGSWKVENVPAPTLVLPDSALKGTPLGEVQIHEPRRQGGRMTASVHLTAKLAKDQGVVLRPVAASYTPIDASRIRGGGLVSEPGASPFDAPVDLPNAPMARRVSFVMQTYGAVQSVEDVTFKTGRIESRFGQPTLIVDQDEVAKTKSGIKLALTRQDDGPKHQPKKIHTDITIRLLCSGEEMTDRGLEGIVPGIDAEIVQPTPESLGVSKIALSFFIGAMPDGQRVFSSTPTLPKTATPGTFKFGPVLITIRLKVTKAKLLSTQMIVLPVNPKIMPPDTNSGGGGGNAVLAPTPQLRVRG